MSSASLQVSSAISSKQAFQILSRHSRASAISAASIRLDGRPSLSTTTRRYGAEATMTGHKQNLLLAQVRGQSGRTYKIEDILQDKGASRGRVFLASEGDTKYILKEIPRNSFPLRSAIYHRLGSNLYVRELEDTAPDHSIFVFAYYDENLLKWTQKGPSVTIIKRVLKQSLRGIAAMHDRDIIHNDIKPNNILLQNVENSSGLGVWQAVITDLEDSAYCPPPGSLIGAQLGNWMWRSPEAHAEGPINKPSDMFAFALVCIYAMAKKVVLEVLEEDLADGEEVTAIVLERQLSYFCEPDAYAHFIQHLRSVRPENPWTEVFEVLRSGFHAGNPREPFALWQLELPCDDCFRDSTVKMTSFDPKRRITAKEAFEHA